MKQYWQRLALKIDALTLRERTIIFVMTALILATLVNSALLDPLFAKQKQLALGIRQDQAQVAAMQAEIQQKVLMQSFDPDKESKARLRELTGQVEELHAQLRDMQKGLVSPDKMSAMLQDMLKQNGKLRLVALKTLPVSDLSSAESTENKTAVQGAVGAAATALVPQQETKQESKSAVQSSIGAIYRHGVELQVEGGYFDILDYLALLESMRWQVFWGKAKLEVEEYPRASLTLTLYTLSLDKKWLNI